MFFILHSPNIKFQILPAFIKQFTKPNRNKNLFAIQLIYIHMLRVPVHACTHNINTNTYRKNQFKYDFVLDLFELKFCCQATENSFYCGPPKNQKKLFACCHFIFVISFCVFFFSITVVLYDPSFLLLCIYRLLFYFSKYILKISLCVSIKTFVQDEISIY